MNKVLAALIGVTVLVIIWEVFWWALGVRPLLPWRLKASLHNYPAEDLYLVDVRTAFEYELFHIDGAENHPELLLNPDLLKEQDPGKTVVAICMTGHRSPLVAYGLKRRGFREVHNLTWGMAGWLLSGGRIKKGKD
ncbi:MAG: rhodanese-like domain-containing protein [Deltaproteobacteria bacterium]|nr:MAG: rhodanese-like domain-containing protein [Deltaproteobacteria bacterium]